MSHMAHMCGMCDMTHSNVTHDVVCMCGMCDMTHSYVDESCREADIVCAHVRTMCYETCRVWYVDKSRRGMRLSVRIRHTSEF